MNTKVGEVSVKKTQEDHLIDNWPVVEPQNPSVCRVPDLHAVHPEYLVRDISKKMYKYFEAKNWTIIVFIALILLLAYFQTRLVWKDAVSKRRSHPQKNHLLN